MLKSSKRKRNGWTNTNGYKMTTDKEYVHRLIVESIIKRKLEAWEVVHHKDCNKLNNAPSNLVICTANYHRTIHAKLRAARLGYVYGEQHLCVKCRCIKPISDFYKTGDYCRHTCMKCYNSAWKYKLYGQYYRAKKKGSRVKLSWLTGGQSVKIV